MVFSFFLLQNTGTPPADLTQYRRHSLYQRKSGVHEGAGFRWFYIEFFSENFVLLRPAPYWVFAAVRSIFSDTIRYKHSYVQYYIVLARVLGGYWGPENHLR